MPKEHGQERGNTLRVYLYAQRTWAGKRKGEFVMERVYKSMRNIGALNIAVGIVVTVIGLAAGTVSIINGAILLKRKSEITF